MVPLSLSVICPVYNEAEVIKNFHRALREELLRSCNDYDWQIVFVLDKSNDNSLEILEEICSYDKRSKLILMSARFGHQLALLAGIDHCDTDMLVMMDSDLQHPPELIPKMINAYHDGYDVVAGIRTDDEGKSWIRKLGSKIFYKIWNGASGLSLTSGEADFRLISSKVAKIFREQVREQNQFLRGLFYWVGFNRTTISYIASPRLNGKTKYPPIRLISFAITSVASFSKWPLQLGIMVGFFSALFALGGFVSIIYDYYAYGSAPTGWYTLATIIFFFSGLQFVFIGIIGQYIGMIFDEVKDRPLYILDRKINFD